MKSAPKSKLPHVEYLDIGDTGMLHEVAVMKKDNLGNTHFIKIEDLDIIDRKRLATILRSRNAHNFELWDLMTQHTLGNGMNALDYFHQLVQVATANGEIYTPSAFKIGYNQNARRKAAPIAESEGDAEPARRGRKKG